MLTEGLAKDDAFSNLKNIEFNLRKLSLQFDAKRSNHIGYPYNLDFDSKSFSHLSQFLINNLGDPYTGSHYGIEVCGMERELISWFMDVWRCDHPDLFWGSVGASGTEGNLWAIYLGREALQNPVLIHSREAHYSIPKAAKILRMETVCVDCEESGTISPSALANALRTAADRHIVLALTCGTTMKGAHDDIAGALRVMDELNIQRDCRYVHVDGALNAMVLPFIDTAPPSIRPSFEHDIDSISTSGHKMIGTPMPCGILVARRQHVARVASGISYLRSDDTTLMGSRNGHAVIAIWSRMMGHGVSGFRADAVSCLARAHRLADKLRALNVPVLHNNWSLTVVFPEPSEELVKKYQLACANKLAHAIVMPNVSDELIEQFVADYAAHQALPNG